jgi:hypothetical protein
LTKKTQKLNNFIFIIITAPLIGRAVLAYENYFFLQFYRPPLIEWSELLNISVKRLAIIQASRKITSNILYFLSELTNGKRKDGKK